MKWNFATLFRPSRVSAFRSTSSTRRRTARPSLEFLEPREVLSTFTWTGTAGDGIWDTGTNWQGGVAPKTGSVDLVFQNTSTNPTITLQSDDTGLVVNSLTVQGGNYTLQGPTSNASQHLTLAAGATVSLDSTPFGGTLTICTSSAPNSLAPNFLGSTTLNGGGKLTLNNSTVSYSGVPSSLLMFQVDASNLTLGSSASYMKTLVQLANGGSILVNDGAIPSVGSVEGNGTIQLGVFGTETGSTGLTVNTPSGESDTLVGSVQGPGGTFTKAGAGSLVISRINPVSAGNPFVLDVQSGAFGLQGISNVAHATFSAGSTFSAALNGTGAGQAAKIIASGAASPITLGGSTLALNLANGYTPAVGATFTLISSANGITGHFANAADSQVVFAGGTPFQVNYSSTAVTLTALPATLTQLTSSANPSTQGSEVTFTATVTSNGSPLPSGSGTVTFYAGATQIGSPVTVGNGGKATSTALSNLPVGGTAITATYSGQVNAFGPSSMTLTQTAIPLTATHLGVAVQPPASVVAGTPFGLTIYAETASNVIDPTFNGNVTVALVTNPSGAIFGGTHTVAAHNGVATFSDLTLNKSGSYTLVVSSNGLTSASPNAINVTSPGGGGGTQPAEIIGQSVLFTQKTNKKGKKIGKPVLTGFQINFNTAMNPATTGNSGNYTLGTYVQVRKRVGRKFVKVLQLKPIAFSVANNPSTNSVSLLLRGKQAFLKGGQITLLGAISSSSGGSLDGNGDGTGGDNAVFNISPNARSISHA